MNASFVKKTLAVAVLGAMGSMAYAQASSVQLYGIVDAAVRHTNNEGPNKGSKTQMIGGGMSQSRWGINITEDLGGGLAAIANLENRFTTDDGATPAPGLTYFAQSWVGLRSKSFGQITMGRQYNILFDAVTSTFPSFPYSPYMEAYKPELGMAMGARANNMLKYMAEFGPVRVGLQYSFDEGNTVAKKGAGLDATPTIALKTAGGYVRYSANGLSLAGAYLNTALPGGTKVDAYSLGGAYRTGPWYLMAGYAVNKRKGLAAGGSGAVDVGVLNSFWQGASNGGFLAGNPALAGGAANKRDMVKVGFGYQATQQLNVGLHYYHAKQSGSSGGYNGKADFIVAVADYAFSKRTDAYFGVDHTKVSGDANVALGTANDARKRTGITVGLRHRF